MSGKFKRFDFKFEEKPDPPVHQSTTEHYVDNIHNEAVKGHEIALKTDQDKKSYKPSNQYFEKQKEKQKVYTHRKKMGENYTKIQVNKLNQELVVSQQDLEAEANKLVNKIKLVEVGKRLFTLRDPAGHLLTNTRGESVYFESRKAAKLLRDELASKYKVYSHVTKGIDHD